MHKCIINMFNFVKENTVEFSELLTSYKKNENISEFLVKLDISQSDENDNK